MSISSRASSKLRALKDPEYDFRGKAKHLGRTRDQDRPVDQDGDGGRGKQEGMYWPARAKTWTIPNRCKRPNEKT